MGEGEDNPFGLEERVQVQGEKIEFEALDVRPKLEKEVKDEVPEKDLICVTEVEQRM